MQQILFVWYTMKGITAMTDLHHHLFRPSHSADVNEWSTLLYGYDKEPRGGDTISNCDVSKLERLSKDSNDGRGPALKVFPDGGEVPIGDLRGGDAADPDEDMLGRPICMLCDWRLDEREPATKCSGIAGLGGMSPNAVLERIPPEVSSIAGRRFFGVSAGCSALERGVVESGRETDPLPLASAVADFHDLRMDLRMLPRSPGVDPGTC